MQTGEKSGQWGDITNVNWELIESSVAGYTSITVSGSGPAVLTAADGIADEARSAILRFTAATGAFDIYAPPVSKTYIVFNDTSYDATLWCSATIGGSSPPPGATGLLIPSGKTTAVWSDGTNFYPSIDHLDGSLEVGGNIVAGGSLSLGTALTVANGGTGQSSYTDGQLLIGNSTGNTLTKSTLTAGSNITITNGNGSITIAATGDTGVSSVTGTAPVVSSGGATPAISLAANYGDTLNPYASKTAKYFLAAPNGAAGVPSFRAIVATDLPNTGVTATSYTNANITVDAQGRITAASSGTAGTGTVTAVNDGAGMNFTSFSTSGTITLGTPSPITSTSTDATTASSHTHSITGAAFLAGAQTFTGQKTFTGGLVSQNINFTTTAGSEESIFSGTDTVVISTGGTGRVTVENGSFKPNSDNSTSLGFTGARWAQVFAAIGTINTSDANTKQDIADLDEAEKRVAVRIKSLIKKYRIIDAVNVKGDAARIHVGVIAQDVRDAFIAEGLDAARYGMFCSDTWWEKMEERLYPPTQEMRMERVIYRSPVEGATEITRLGIRYDELLAFVIAAM
jgi:hypothetical protein